MKTEAEIAEIVASMGEALSREDVRGEEFGGQLATLVGVLVLDVRRIANSLAVIAENTKPQFPGTGG